MKLPEIRISYARLIDPVYRSAFRSDPSNKGRQYPSPDAIRRKIRVYRRAWVMHEKAILRGACKALGLNFQHNIIDVHIVGRGTATSYPLVIGSRRPPDDFVDVLAHELVHRLLAFNTQEADIMPTLKRLLPREPWQVQIHVAVHTVLQYLYLDILGDPKRLSRDIQDPKRFPSVYSRAWKIVEQRSYKNLLATFRKALRRNRR